MLGASHLLSIKYKELPRVACTLLLSMAMLLHPAHAVIEIEITQGGGNAIPIAM